MKFVSYEGKKGVDLCELQYFYTLHSLTGINLTGLIFVLNECVVSDLLTKMLFYVETDEALKKHVFKKHL